MPKNPLIAWALTVGLYVLNTGWIPILFIAAWCFVEEAWGPPTSFPLLDEGMNLLRIGFLWCFVSMCVMTALLRRALQTAADDKSKRA